jgi:hypothetical protein
MARTADRGGWPTWTAWGSLVWSATYAVAGATWWVGASWYPFAEVPPDRSSASLIEGMPASVIGPVFVVAGTVGVAAAIAFLTSSNTAVRRSAVIVGSVLALAATCLVPDYTILALLALWPVLLVFAVTGVQGAQEGVGDILYWHRINLLLVFVGGLLWAGSTLAACRRSRGACVRCGRASTRPQLPTAARVERLSLLGRRFVWLAVLATIPYDVTRFAWFLGWGLGLSEEMYASLHDPPELLAVGLALGALSTGGALLTHGLVAPWGERFPRWMPRYAGRRVPPMLAVVPAGVVAVSLPPASIMFAGSRVNGGFDMENWGTWLPSLFWLAWAVGLGGAAWTYYLRRRGPCRHCATSAPAPHAATRW